jgi:hypothetical protein
VFRSCALLIVLLLAGCSKEPPKPRLRVLGEGFIGQHSVTLREEISPRSPDAATLHFGDKVEIVERRRSFLRVRSGDGKLGWLNARYLISAQQMEEIENLAQQHRETPRLGQAKVFDALNVHNIPNRQSPSFAQIPAAGIVDVLAYQLAPRSAYRAPNLIEDPRKKRPARRREKAPQTDELPPPPAPAPPPPPEDWLELSKSRLEPEEEAPKPPVRMDDWTLVRLDDGKVGWALSSMLVMAIPDEVAQYSEGHRIMGYWPVGELRDGDGSHQHWLWITRADKNSPYVFDGFRVFMYSARRKRYEQAYREKNVRGFLPVEVVQPGSKKDYLSEFTIVSENEIGQKIRRRFAFLGYMVQKLGEEVLGPAGS